MDKRKVNGGGTHGDDLDDRAIKRRKASDHLDGAETPETTTQIGLQLVETLKLTADKSGRQIAIAFLSLPSKRDLPDYYDVIKMPIAIDTIEAKLRRREFPNLSALESYFKRMISNAKEYNERGSEIYEDSERLRKALSNFMTRHNPAYKTPGYQALPTPIPPSLSQAGQPPSDEDADAEGEPDPDVETHSPVKRKISRPLKIVQTQRSSATPALSEYQYVGIGFDGLTFQQAQEKVVEEMIRKKEFEEDEFAHFEPFLVLPSRTEYRDYYKVIKNPVSLKTFQKRIKGVQGRNAATGVSEFKSWALFEEEASVIWKNAYQYNEDGSSIYALAQELEKTFRKYLQEAKAVVQEPAGTKIKLKLNDGPKEKIMLKFGNGNKPSPVASPAPCAPQPLPQTNGSTSAAIATNGSSRRNPFGGSQTSTTPAPSLDQLERARSASGSAPSPTPSNSALVKKEDAPRNSPAVTPGHSTSQAVSTPGLSGSSMLPPSTPSLPNAYSSSGNTQPLNHHVQQNNSNSSFEAMWRAPGKDASDAMITNLSLATHPGLNLSKHFKMDIPPSPSMTHQSVTINLPNTHYFLQIKPTISPALFERQHRLFVTSGIQRLHALPTIPGHAVDTRHPLFEARFAPGVNRVEVELIAALPKGSPKPINGQDFELEKITVFVNVAKV